MMKKHDTVGIDLVAMGVNDIITQGAEPLFFLDYFVCGKLDVDVAEMVVRGIAAGCRQAGCVLIGGETAEHPGDFPKGEYDLAGFVVGVIERKRVLNPESIVPGDVLIGLPSSGLHSNGYSLARKVLLDVGRLKLRQQVPELGRSLGEELLEPTRIYAKISSGSVRKISDQRRSPYHGRRYSGQSAENFTRRAARLDQPGKLACSAGVRFDPKDRTRFTRRDGPDIQ